MTRTRTTTETLETAAKDTYEVKNTVDGMVLLAFPDCDAEYVLTIVEADDLSEMLAAGADRARAAATAARGTPESHGKN